MEGDQDLFHVLKIPMVGSTEPSLCERSCCALLD